jgi:hypothetical protein
MGTIRLLLLIVICAFQPLASAETANDAGLLVGTWSRSISTNGRVVYEEQSYLSDGTFCSFSLDTSDHEHVVRHRVGTWSLKSGILGVSVSSATDPQDIVKSPVALISHVVTLNEFRLITGIEVTDAGFFTTQYTKVRSDRGRQLCEL